jgi:ABC-type bacteriocin/lantibiotic exporter with double-glycine peptidase domain
MKYQQKPHYCGPASIQNALLAMGQRVGQDKIARLCGTSADGTDDHEIIAGLKALNLNYVELKTDIWNEARNFLDLHVGQLGNPVILCIERWLHWVCVIGGLGPQSKMRYVVYDSARFDYNKINNGVNMWGWKKLRNEWTAGHRVDVEHTGAYYGIAVIK